MEPVCCKTGSTPFRGRALDGSNAYKRLQVYLVLPFLRYDNLRLRRFPTIERGFFWSTRYADSLRVLLTKLLIS